MTCIVDEIYMLREEKQNAQVEGAAREGNETANQ